jgi:hypothetical protein
MESVGWSVNMELSKGHEDYYIVGCNAMQNGRYSHFRARATVNGITSQTTILIVTAIISHLYD